MRTYSATPFFFVFSLFCISASAQTEVTIDDFSMIVGNWQGTGFDSDLEEIWSAPTHGQMMGMFRMSNDEGIILTEYMSIQEGENGFDMRVKHFSPQFEGWESKEEYISFSFIEITENKIVFEGLLIEKLSNNDLIYHLDVQQEDGSILVQELRYKRVKK